MKSEVLEKKIAIHIQSEVQFFSLKPLLDELKRLKYDFKIVIDYFKNDESGYNKMSTQTAKLIMAAGFKVYDIEDFSNDVFDLYLTSYVDEKIKANCFAKFEYGTLNIKPSLTYTPETMGGFHAFLCQSTVTKTLLQAYGMTFSVENLRFYGKKRKALNRRKAKVLFAPTYNDEETEEDLANVIRELKKEFIVAVKGHHGTQYLNANAGKKDILEQLADEYYTSETSLSDLILDADVCLFGNSSAIAEALYMNVPCAIFARDLDLFKIGDLHTTQYEIVEEGYIPWTDDIKLVRKIIEEAMSEKYRERQMKLSNKFFTKEFKTGVQGYLDVINYLLCDKDAMDYLKLKKYIKSVERDEKKRLEDIIKNDKDIINNDNALFEDYAKRKLYKLADKLYKIEGKFIHGKS